MNDSIFTEEELAEERWLPVVGYEGLYEVSDLGRVISLKSNKMLKPATQSLRSFVRLYNTGVKSDYRVAQLVATAFIGPARSGYFGDSISQDKSDCRLSNVKYSLKRNSEETWRKVLEKTDYDVETGCIIVPNVSNDYTSVDLYSANGTSKHSAKSHRVVYEALVGPIPEGLVLDHLCRVLNCVNPNHLEPVTHQENVRRGVGPTAVNSQKTHCPQNHEYTKENTYYGNGSRYCKICLSVKRKNRYQRTGG